MSRHERRLAIACRETRQGVMRLVNIIESASNLAALDRIGLDRGALLDALGRYLRRTEELSEAALRPPCLGLLGLTGSGTGRITEALIGRAGGTGIDVRLASHSEPIDHGTVLDPVGSRLGCAAVRRFQVRPASSSAKAPVSLGLLRSTDLVMILVRMHAASEQRRPDRGPDGDELRRAGIALGKHLGLFVVPGMTNADLQAIREHVNTQYSSRPLTRLLEASGYWSSAAAMVTHLPNAARAELLSPLWGGTPQLTGIFSELMDALELIGYADDVLCPIDGVARHDRATGAVTARSDTILAGETAAGFARGDTDPVEVQTRARQAARAHRGTLAALTAEVRWTVVAPPGSMLSAADLLQLPEIAAEPVGYLGGLPAANDNDPLIRAFHAAKAAHLVHRAALLHELTGLLTVVDRRDGRSHALAPLVADWVGISQGATAAARAETDPTLTVALTGFEDGAGQEASGKPVVKLLDTVLGSVHPAGPLQWLPDAPFDRVALLGDPGRFRDGRSAGGIDAGALASDPSARVHVATLQRALADLEGPNGGLARLSELAGRGVETIVKQSQIAEELAGTCRELRALIDRHLLRAPSLYGRLNRRQRDALALVARLRTPAARDRFGVLLKAVQVGEAELAAAVYSFETRPRLQAPAASAGVLPRDGAARLDAGDGRPPEGLSARTFAGAVLAHWSAGLRTQARDPALAEAVGLAPRLLHTLSEELIAGAARLSLVDRLARRLEPLLLASGEAQARASMVALQAVEMIGTFVAELGDAGAARGRDGHWRQDLPAPGGGALVRNLEGRRSETHGPEHRSLEDRLASFHDRWCSAFVDFVKLNASEAPGFEVAASDRDELQELLKLFGFYAVE